MFLLGKCHFIELIHWVFAKCLIFFTSCGVKYQGVMETSLILASHTGLLPIIPHLATRDKDCSYFNIWLSMARLNLKWKPRSVYFTGSHDMEFMFMFGYSDHIHYVIAFKTRHCNREFWTASGDSFFNMDIIGLYTPMPCTVLHPVIGQV